MYALAEKRCGNFKTCGTNGNELSGTSKVNIDLGEQFAAGQYYLHVGQCQDAVAPKNRIVQLMTVPLIQGTLRYAYKVEYLHPSGTATSTGRRSQRRGTSRSARTRSTVVCARRRCATRQGCSPRCVPSFARRSVCLARNRAR